MQRVQIKSLILIVSALALVGCSSLPPPTPYEVIDKENAATITVSSPQGYFVTANTTVPESNCTELLEMTDINSDKMTSSYLIESNKNIPIHIFLRENEYAAIGKQCQFSLFFVPEAGLNYTLDTILDENRNVCSNSFGISGDLASQPNIQVIDEVFYIEQGCSGEEIQTVENSDNFETGMYNVSLSQVLVYDYHPKRLEPKE